MKIKLMIFCLVVVSVLRGSQYQDGFLESAVRLSLHHGKEGDYSPIIFYGNCDLDDLKVMMYRPVIKDIVDDELGENKQSIMLISDSFRKIDGNKVRTFFEIKMGKKTLDNNCVNLFECDRVYEQTKIEVINQLDVDEQIDKKSMKMLKGHLVMLNMRHSGTVAKTSFYATLVNQLLNMKKTSIIAIVGPDYNGVDLEKQCEENNSKAIIFNKKSSSISPIFVGVGFFCLGVIVGLICYFKFGR